jgi:hypothetical protein
MYLNQDRFACYVETSVNLSFMLEVHACDKFTHVPK